MIISFLEGSDIMETGVEQRINRQLRRIIKDVQDIKMYFYCTSNFMTLCEWEIRKLQATYPQKRIEVLRVIESNDILKFVPAVQYMGHIMPCDDDVNSAGNLLKWLVDQSDYILCYMDLLMSSAKGRVNAFQYARTRLGERCINFCSGEAMSQVREQIPRLPKWERRALEGKLAGEKKKTVANALNVSTGTVHKYELSGQKNVISRIYEQKRPERHCAVFGFPMESFTSEYADVFEETIQYLIHYCGVSYFILPEEQQRVSLPLTRLISTTIRRSATPVKMGRMRAVEVAEGAWQPLDGDVFCYERHSKGYIAHILEERKAMIDIVDIVLCDVDVIRRSGLSYAGKKHIPVINIANVYKEAELEPV